MNRRHFIAGLLVTGAVLAMPRYVFGREGERFAITMSDEEWKEKLSPEAYRVLRKHGTEAPKTSPLNDEHRRGVFKCAGCGWPLYASAQKFDSGTGWPSFWAPINAEAVGTSQDTMLLMPRTEVHCAHCGGHLGHVFEDGPKPTGLRYCMNGVALSFSPISPTP